MLKNKQLNKQIFVSQAEVVYSYFHTVVNTTTICHDSTQRPQLSSSTSSTVTMQHFLAGSNQVALKERGTVNSTHCENTLIIKIKCNNF